MCYCAHNTNIIAYILINIFYLKYGSLFNMPRSAPKKHTSSYGTALKIIGFCTATGVAIAVPIYITLALDAVDQHERENYPVRYAWNRMLGLPGIDPTQRIEAISAGVGVGLINGGMVGGAVGVCAASIYGAGKLIGYAGSRLFARLNPASSVNPAVSDRVDSDEKPRLR